MRKHHNFIILDIECLINLKGLLAYIAERIQLGRLCLNCDKQFKSGYSCQQHMVDQGHCMMPFDNDEEFEIFYDFARAYKDCGFDYKTVSQAEKEHDMMEERKQASPSKQEKVDEVSSDDWEDCDLENDEDTEDFEVVDNDENDGTSSFDMLNSTTSKDKTHTESESFTLLESKTGSKNHTE